MSSFLLATGSVRKSLFSCGTGVTVIFTNQWPRANVLEMVDLTPQTNNDWTCTLAGCWEARRRKGNGSIEMGCNLGQGNTVSAPVGKQEEIVCVFCCPRREHKGKQFYHCKEKIADSGLLRFADCPQTSMMSSKRAWPMVV